MHDTCIYAWRCFEPFSGRFSQFTHTIKVDHSPLILYTILRFYSVFSLFQSKCEGKCGASCMVKIVRRPFQRRLISLMWFSVPGFGIRIFFPQISDTAIWHFILDVISYLLSKSEFTVPLKNESPHGREVKKHCFIIPRSKEPC